MEPPFLDTSGRRLWQPRIGFIRGNADLFGSSGADLLQRSTRWRPTVRRDRRGWRGSWRRFAGYFGFKIETA